MVAQAEHFVAWENGFRTMNPPAVGRSGALTSALLAEGVALLAAGQATDNSLVAPTEFLRLRDVAHRQGRLRTRHVRDDHRSGWQPGETVNMVLHETGPGADPDFPLNAAADVNGNIVNDAWAPNEGDLGRRFYLTAIGAASTARKPTFTDARQFTLTISGGGSVTLDTTTGAHPDSFKVPVACGGTNSNITSWTFTSTCSSITLNDNSATGTLTANANLGSTFSGWSSANNFTGCTSTTSPCGFSVTSSNPAITATFSQLPDLTVTKTNNVSGSTVYPSPWNWSITVSNSGTATALIPSGQVLFRDQLPNANASYTALSVVRVGVTGTINCAIAGSDLTCSASTGATLAAGGHVDVQFTATPGAPGTFVNPRAGGVCAVDPDGGITEVSANRTTGAATA